MSACMNTLAMIPQHCWLTPYLEMSVFPYFRDFNMCMCIPISVM